MDKVVRWFKDAWSNIMDWFAVVGLCVVTFFYRIWRRLKQLPVLPIKNVNYKKLRRPWNAYTRHVVKGVRWANRRLRFERNELMVAALKKLEIDFGLLYRREMVRLGVYAKPPAPDKVPQWAVEVLSKYELALRDH